MNIVENSTPEEGLDFKKKLLEFLKSNKVNLTDLKIDITSSEDEEENEKEAEVVDETHSKIGEKNKSSTPAEDDNDNFQAKFIELKKCLDTELPTAIAKLNTELKMMSKGVTIVQPLSSNELDAFIWQFHVSFEWENKNLKCWSFKIEILR